jgi:hypothetical protein
MGAAALRSPFGESRRRTSSMVGGIAQDAGLTVEEFRKLL